MEYPANIQSVDTSRPDMFVTWTKGDERSKNLAFATAAKALSRAEPIHRSNGSSFRDIRPGVHIREGMSRSDYNVYRPNEALPAKPKDIIASCMLAYHKVGLIRNIIDLMGDFGSQGIRLVHPVKKYEKFYREWFKKVGGKDRSERFLNMLYRTGNVIVKRTTAKLRAKDEERLQQGRASPDIDSIPPSIQPERREIPWEYTYFNPLSVEVIQEDLSVFTTKKYRYAVKVPDKIAGIIKSPKTRDERDLVAELPSEIVAAVRKGGKLIRLDPEKVFVYHYKKDDWMAWAYPMTYAVLDDVILLEKLKLADLAALDGATSHIRVWKLGSFEHQVLPTQAAVAKLADMLMNISAGMSMDLIWGPDLQLEETATDMANFLGEEKYVATWNSIFAGLGIPPTLTGAAQSGGFTNNFISLKTLTERLSYGRDVLTDFWNQEISLVQKAMGHNQPAQVVFAHMSLSDEAAEKALMLQLADRNFISVEAVQQRFGEIPELETVRLRREQREREKGMLPDKLGPYPNHIDALEKIALQKGVITPSELGMILLPRKPGELSPIEMQVQPSDDEEIDDKPTGVPGQGRPKNSKDTQKRKQKRVLPRGASQSFLDTFVWAKEAQKTIAEIVHPLYLTALDKKNLRGLTTEEVNNLEKYKFVILCQLKPFVNITGELIAQVNEQELGLPYQVLQLYRQTLASYVQKFGKEPSVDHVREIQCSVYALYKGEHEDGED